MTRSEWNGPKSDLWNFGVTVEFPQGKRVGPRGPETESKSEWRVVWGGEVHPTRRRHEEMGVWRGV